MTTVKTYEWTESRRYLTRRVQSAIMADSLEDLRDSAWQHVRRTIGDEFNYNDFLAGDDIYRMNASELAAVATMTADKMAKRWASEYEYVSIPLTGALGDWLRNKDDIESLVIEALERLRASEQGSSANPVLCQNPAQGLTC